MRRKYEVPLNLHQFDGEGGAGASAGEGIGITQGEGQTAAESKSGRKEDLSNIQYGKQEESQAANANSGQSEIHVTTPESEAQEVRKAQFEAMIAKGGEYHDFFAEKTQSIIDKRFSSTKQMESTLDALTPAMELLANRYGVDPSNVEALTQAIEEDESFLEEEAVERGMDVETLKEIKRLERENANFQRERQRQENQEKANQELQKWYQQGEALKEYYPDFDLATEADNEQFVSLLKNGIDVKTAYEVIHMDELIPGAMARTASEVKQRMAQSQQSRASRPVEAGMKANSGVVTKTDVSKLTKKDCEEIERRVARGEKISF